MGLKLVQVMQAPKGWSYALHIFFASGVIFNIAIFVEKEVKQYAQCRCNFIFIQEIWYIFIDGYGILLSAVLTCIGFTYTRRQKEKLVGIENPIHYKNPLPNIWIWITVNIISQVFGFA